MSAQDHPVKMQCRLISGLLDPNAVEVLLPDEIGTGGWSVNVRSSGDRGHPAVCQNTACTPRGVKFTVCEKE